MKRVISNKALCAALIAAAFAGAGAGPASTQAFAQAVTRDGSLLPHYYGTDGELKWDGWGPSAAEHQAAAPPRRLYLSPKPHAHRSHAN